MRSGGSAAVVSATCGVDALGEDMRARVRRAGGVVVVGGVGGGGVVRGRRGSSRGEW